MGERFETTRGNQKETRDSKGRGAMKKWFKRLTLPIVLLWLFGGVYLGVPVLVVVIVGGIIVISLLWLHAEDPSILDGWIWKSLLANEKYWKRLAKKEKKKNPQYNGVTDHVLVEILKRKYCPPHLQANFEMEDRQRRKEPR
jgi:hypothetical protein